jgi:DNA-binding transcriptional MerR regulator
VAGTRTYQVKQAAGMSGVSVRTLHHYDAIGLLVPSARTAAGYRLYTGDDLLRLQQILIGRELGLALEEIRRLLDDPRVDRKTALLNQRERLRERVRETAAMIRAIDVALTALEGKGAEMNMEALFEGFDSSRYEDEARERWSTTAAFSEAEKRTKRYSADDWKALKAEQAAIYAAAHAALKAGTSPDQAAAMDIAERHRLSIDRWFYPCSHQMHAGLASMYESDDRFRQSIDAHGEGLTTFLAAAIRANESRP